MFQNQDEPQKLIRAAINNTINDQDLKRLRKVLAVKFIDNKYDSKEEQLVVSAYALFSDADRRKRYIDKVLIQWRIDSLSQS